jgi:hypothetical protein
MLQGSPRQSAATRRAAYLSSAMEMRKMAQNARSLELQEGFMRLAVLYEELAEYAELASADMPRFEPQQQ